MTSRRAMLLWVSLAGAILLLHVAHRFREPLTFDDAYMVLRYAKQMLAGHGYAWNPDGKQVFGVTGALHLFAVALLRALLPVSDSAVLALASLSFALLSGLALARVSVGVLRSRLRETPWRVAAGVWLFLLAQRLFIAEALNGMDAMSAFFANTLVAGTALWLARTGETRALAAVVGAALLAIVARPDDGLYATGVPFLAVALEGPRPRLRLLVRLVLALALALAAYLTVTTAVFGSPLPLPFYAKSLGYFSEYTAAHYWNPFEYLGLILGMWLPALLIVLLGATRRTAPELVALFAPVAVTFTYYFSVIQIMGMEARYYVPATPFAVLGAVVVVDDLVASGDGARELLRGIATRWPLALLLAIAAPTALRDLELRYMPRPDDPNPSFPGDCYERKAPGRLPPVGYEDVIEDLARLVNALPTGARIALSEHGRVGASAPQVTLDDLIALHDPEFAHHGFDPDLELARKPDAIWFPHYAYVPLWHGLATDPRLWADYDVWPDALLYGFAIRRDSPYRDQIHAGFAAMWKKLYPREDLEAWRATRLRSEWLECRRESRVHPPADLGNPPR